MEFQQFWSKLSIELRSKKQFHTLKRLSKFEARFQYPDIITVTPASTSITREIPMTQFQGMWNLMKDDLRNERYVNTGKRFYTYWSSSYISTFIDHIVKDQNME